MTKQEDLLVRLFANLFDLRQPNPVYLESQRASLDESLVITVVISVCAGAQSVCPSSSSSSAESTVKEVQKKNGLRSRQSRREEGIFYVTKPVTTLFTFAFIVQEISIRYLLTSSVSDVQCNRTTITHSEHPFVNQC